MTDRACSACWRVTESYGGSEVAKRWLCGDCTDRRLSELMRLRAERRAAKNAAAQRKDPVVCS